jgi:DNA-binding winged helix-turn-helix (wHTH) protein
MMSAFRFGSFCLFPRQRLLLESGRVVQLGSRALDILSVLVERPGELVDKRELMARVWPSTTVCEHNLTVHISALRRVLRDGGCNRGIVNVPGRGYLFVVPVDKSNVCAASQQAELQAVAA